MERAYWVDSSDQGYSNLICQWRFYFSTTAYLLQVFEAVDYPAHGNVVYAVTP